MHLALGGFVVLGLRGVLRVCSSQHIICNKTVCTAQSCSSQRQSMKGRAPRPGPELFVVLGLQVLESPGKMLQNSVCTAESCGS